MSACYDREQILSDKPLDPFQGGVASLSIHMPRLQTWLAAIQWLGFMFANTVVIPLSIGGAFHLSSGQISGDMARSFIFTGIACLLQGLIGHGLPLMEGQSGLWWGVILSLTNIGVTAGTPLAVVGGSLATGMLLGGLAIALAGLFHLHRLLNRLFTPVVMAVLLFLLSSQLVDIFFRGMMHIDASGEIDIPVAGLSIVLVLVVGGLTIAARGLLSNFSILIGLSLGWITFVLLFGQASQPVLPSMHSISETFVWGHPAFNFGIVFATVLTALINTTNSIATLRAAEPLFHITVNNAQYRRSFLLTGTYTVLSGVFSLVPYAPYTSSIGFLRTTRLLDRAPYLLGAALFALLGLIPSFAGFFSTLPISVGDAVLFVAYLQLFGSALQNIEGLQFTFRTIFRIALPTLSGLAVLSTPSHAFASIPGFAESILANGLLVGISTSVVLENLIPWQRLERNAS